MLDFLFTSYMNWSLLLVLVLSYTALFFLVGLSMVPGIKHLQKRFKQQFGQPLSEEAVSALSLEDRTTWHRIHFDEYQRTPYRWIELLVALFHYPSIIVLSVLLKRNTLPHIPTYFITGAVYVAAFYFLLR